mmetsp:Transcript_10076/g.38148  ORF Transcript_10076/g.38148 Transcript_10076/m.38148 type:complete len:613 (+) Transcript_10076:1127-2965(+)
MLLVVDGIHGRVRQRVLSAELLQVVLPEHRGVRPVVLGRLQVAAQGVVEAKADLPRRGSFGRILLPHVGHDLGIACRAVLGDRRPLVSVEDGFVQVELRQALERLPSRPELPQGDAQRVDVHRLGVALLPVDQLRRHVGHGPHDGHLTVLLALAERRKQRALPEVPQLRRELLREEEVLRLEIPMDDGWILAVQVLHGGGGVDGGTESPPHAPQLPVLQAQLQVAPVAELDHHRDLRGPHAHAVESDDVLVPQRRAQGRFPREPGDLGGVELRRREDLDRHGLSLQLAEEDVRRASGADLFPDLQVPELDVDLALGGQHGLEGGVHGAQVHLRPRRLAVPILVLEVDPALVVLPQAPPELRVGHDREHERDGVEEEERRGGHHVADGEDGRVGVGQEDGIEDAVVEAVTDGHEDDGSVGRAPQLHAGLDDVEQQQRAEEERRHGGHAEEDPAEVGGAVAPEDDAQADPDERDDADVGRELEQRSGQRHDAHGGLLEEQGHDHHGHEEEERHAEQAVRPLIASRLGQKGQSLQTAEQEEQEREHRHDGAIGRQHRLPKHLSLNADAAGNTRQYDRADHRAGHAHQHHHIVHGHHAGRAASSGPQSRNRSRSRS